jgi:hypothetical protein
VSIFVILFFLAGTYATFLKAPRYIEIVTEKTRSDQVILSSGQSVIEHRTAERRSTYTSQTFEIENLGSRGSDARVSFVPSYLDTKVPVELTSFRKTTGDWEIDSHLMRYTSNKVGSSATWKGFGAGISLAISTNTPDVRLRIRWNGV